MNRKVYTYMYSKINEIPVYWLEEMKNYHLINAVFNQKKTFLIQ
jgi:hypothetical protein